MIARSIRGWAGTLAVVACLATSAVGADASPAHTPGPIPSPVIRLSSNATDVQPFIVGGRDATQAYSFVASLQNPSADGTLKHFCTASLITPRWLVTAAHCTPDRIVPGTTKARVGSTDRTKGGSLAGVKRVVMHPGFDWDKPADDLSLVELDRAVPHRPVMLAGNAGRVGSENRIMGWGVVCDADLVNDPVCKTPPLMLQELDTKRLPDAKCSFFDRRLELCIGSRDESRAQACFGDSGGPLVKEVRRGRWALIGATTGDGDDSKMRPYVCTTAPPAEPGEELKAGSGIWQDLSKYRPWIARTLWDCDRSEGEQLQASMREADYLMAAA